MEKVIFEGCTLACSISSKTAKPSGSFRAFAQPSIRLLYLRRAVKTAQDGPGGMISSHFRPRAFNSLLKARALWTSPM